MPEHVVLDEKIIGFELSSTKKLFQWPAATAIDGKEKNQSDDDEIMSLDLNNMPTLQKYFLIRSAVLGLGAKPNQRNLVNLKITENDGTKIILDQPILSLSLNNNDFVTNLGFRLLINETTEVTFRLIEGDGPVHFITSKVLEPPFDLNGSDDDDDDDMLSLSTGVSDDEIDLHAGGGDKHSQQQQQLLSKKGAIKKTKLHTEKVVPQASLSQSSQNSGAEQKKKRKRKSEE